MLNWLFTTLTKVRLEIRPFLVFREDLTGIPAGGGFENRADLEFVWVGEERLAEMLALPERDFPPAVLRARFTRGNLCLGLVKDGRLIAFSWAAVGMFYFGNYRFPLAANEAYLFGAYTSPEFRGDGLAGLLRHRLYQELMARGRSCLYSVSLRYNQPAIRFKEKLGARVVDTGLSIRLFNRWQWGTRARPARLRASPPEGVGRRSPVTPWR
jgi:GNAT superfamily N-acetyltransferase